MEDIPVPWGCLFFARGGTEPSARGVHLFTKCSLKAPKLVSFPENYPYICFRARFSADGSSVNIYSLGSFTYEMSLDEFDAQAEDYNSSDSSVDLSYLAGIWYLDGDLDADSYIYIDSSGGLWGLYERASGAEATEVDGGFISAPTDVDDVYYAVSTTYQDVTYEFTLFDTDSIMWGGENDYYERLE